MSKRADRAKTPFRAKAISLAVASCFSVVASTAWSNPTGGMVASGSAAFSQQGNLLSITNSPNAVINWQGFSIGTAEITRFIQQSSASAVLNRVIGSDPSAILGALQSNGRVFLINPNGILFGAGAQINVGGLVASTLGLSNADFLAGKYNFTATPGAGSVVNQGAITTPSGGQVYLVAPNVQNTGIITSPKGDVILAAGYSVELVDAGTPALRVQITAPDTQTLNLGEIIASSGKIGIYAGLIHNKGTINADSAVAGADGAILLKATQNVSLDAGSVVSAGGVNGSSGGSVSIQGSGVIQSGRVSADGVADGGNVTINAASIIQTQSAYTSAKGGNGAGGSVVLDGGTSGNVFTSGTLSATGDQGGQIQLLGSSLSLFAANVDASGTHGGGTILVGGDTQGGGTTPHAQSVFVNFASTLNADASSQGNGGKVIVWSDLSTTFDGSISARGGPVGGDGGTMEVSSEGQAFFGGAANASAPHGNPGSLLFDPKNIIISDSATSTSLSQSDLTDPHPDGGTFGDHLTMLSNGNVVITDSNDSFGASGAGAAYLFQGSNGSLISALVGDTANDHVGSGGIETLSANNNYLILSPQWHSSTGAVTFGSGTTGTGGGGTPVALSAANSLVGSLPGDNIGSDGITFLNNGNFLVQSSTWGGGKGAVTFGTSTAGVSGTVSATNSLIGSLTTDAIGAGVGGEGAIHILENGNYLVLSPNWNNNAGAVTFGTQSAGVSGPISSTNSLVGTIQGVNGDFVGSNDEDPSSAIVDVGAFGSGNYVVVTPQWTGDSGAVTFGSGTSGVTGVISSSNSLVGQAGGDYVGDSGVQRLDFSTGNYLVFSPRWGNGATPTAIPDAGAVTWGSGSSGVAGPVTSANSVVGAFNNDSVGSGGFFSSVHPLVNGNLLILTPSYDGGEGAVTWMNSATGQLSDMSHGGVISGDPMVGPVNSVVGGFNNDNVGSGGIIDLENNFNGNYFGNAIIVTPGFDFGTGAVTWISGSTGHISDSSTGGVISSVNSLVGSGSSDSVGSGGVTELAQGNVIIRSPNFNNGAGAVTWMSGLDGSLTQPDGGGSGAVVSSTNSLVGSLSTDNVGGSAGLMLSTGNYVAVTSQWDNVSGMGPYGAVTYIDGSTGHLLGTTPNGAAVSSDNSLIGYTQGDTLGSGGVVEVGSGNYLIVSPSWNGRSPFPTLPDVGSIMFSSSASPLRGTLDGVTIIPITGSTTGDMIGSGGVKTLFSGNALVFSPHWSGGEGAITWINGSTGKTTVSSATTVTSGNSLVGSSTSDAVGNGGPGSVTQLSSNALIVKNSSWSGAAGAVTWMNGSTGLLNDGVSTGSTISASNSLVGAHSGDGAGSGSLIFLSGNNILIETPNYQGVSGTNTDVGAVTWMNGSTGALSNGLLGGQINTGNSLVGSADFDNVGDPMVTTLSNGNILIRDQDWQSSTGAITWMKSATGTLSDGLTGGPVSSGNSLLGSITGENFGNSGTGITSVGSGNIAISNSDFHNGNSDTPFAGSVTWMNGATGKLSDGNPGGIIGAGNSLIGTSLGDEVGGSGISVLSSGNYLVLSPDWNGNTGAVTWVNGNTGKLADGISTGGTITAGNSISGSTSGDDVGNDGIFQFSNGNYLVRSPNWNGNRGAVTLGIGSTGTVGVISSGNSLVGSNPGDFVGEGSEGCCGFAAVVEYPSSGSFTVQSGLWNNGAGAVTLGSTTTGITGVISAANSIVGNTAGDDMQFVAVDSTNHTFYVTFAEQPGGRVAIGSSIYTAASAGGNLLFTDNPSSDVSISPASITSIIDGNTALILQANNDITVSSAINASNGGSGVGALTFQAGRTINLNASIDTGGGNLIMTANDPGAIAANRDAGAGGITMASGTSINTGAGSVAMLVGSGAQAGDILLGGSVSGNSVTLTSSGGIFNIGNGTLSGPTIFLDAFYGIGTLAAPLFVQPSISSGLQAFNSFSGDISLFQPSGDLTVGSSGGALFGNGGGGYILQTGSGNINLTSSAPSSGNMFVAAAGDVNVSNYFNSGDILLKASNNVNITGGGVHAGGQLALNATGDVNVMDAEATAGTSLSVTTGGNLNVIASSSPTMLAAGTDLTTAIAGEITVQGGSASGASAQITNYSGSSSDGGLLSVVARGKIMLKGGSGQDAYAQIFGQPDVFAVLASAASLITLDTGTGDNAYARIWAQRPSTIHVNFPLRSQGGYLINGLNVVSDGDTGFFVGDPGSESAAILGINLIVDYGTSSLPDAVQMALNYLTVQFDSDGKPLSKKSTDEKKSDKDDTSNSGKEPQLCR